MTALMTRGRAWATRKRASRFLGCIAILLLAGASGCDGLFSAELTLSQLREISEEVEATFEESGRLLNNGDFEGAAGLYADDPRFLWVEDGSLRYTSPAQVAEAFAQLRQFKTAQFAYDSPRITVLSRDAAILFTNYTTTLGSPESAFIFTGAVTITMVRTDAGWRFLQGHRSSSREWSGQTEMALP